MLFDPFRKLLDDAQLESSHNRRSTIGTERRRRTETASLSGLLADAFEASLVVALHLSPNAGGAKRIGVIRHVSNEIVVLRTGSTNFHAVRRSAMAVVSVVGPTVTGLLTSEREVEAATMQELLFVAADLRLDANLHIGGDRWLTGVICGCGPDVCWLRSSTDAENSSLAGGSTENSTLVHVAIDAIQEVVLSNA